MCSQAETQMKCHCGIQMKNYQRIKWNPSKHNVLHFVVFILIQKHSGFISSQALNRGRLACCISGVLSSLFCSSISFFNSIFKANLKKEKKNSAFVSNLSSLPFACRLCPQTPTHILTLLPDLPHPCGFALSILVLNPEPGLGQEGLWGRDIQVFFPWRTIHLVPIISFSSSLHQYNVLIAPVLNTHKLFSPCHECQLHGSFTCCRVKLSALRNHPLHPRRDLQRGMQWVFTPFCSDWAQFFTAAQDFQIWAPAF